MWQCFETMINFIQQINNNGILSTTATAKSFLREKADQL
jgi:hypothetical protein